jgi:tetratricopeptide (TPR) repeat protein
VLLCGATGHSACRDPLYRSHETSTGLGRGLRLARLIMLDPADARHPISLGDVLDRAGRLEEAVKSFRAGLALKPHYSEADCRVMLASTLKRLGKIDEAISEWRTVAEMEPMYPSYDIPIMEAKQELEHHGRSA